MCLFCKIINGEIPCKKVYESNSSIAFLDISPVSKGHCLVLPKKHYDNYLLMPENEICEYQKDIHIVCKKINELLNPNGINILTNINESAGQTVMHTHFHIIPRYDNNDMIKIEFGKSIECDIDNIHTLLKKDIQ